MKVQVVCFVLVVVYALSVRGQDERCFDKEKGEAKFKPIKEKCRAEFPKGSEDRKMKIKTCVLKATGMVNDDMELDFDKFKNEGLEYVVLKKDEISEKMQECWDVASGEGAEKMKEFFKCYKPAITELCPVDVEDWKKCEQEDA